MGVIKNNFDLTEKQALDLFNNKFWEPLSHRERATFQMHCERLCMPFDVFHESITKTLGRDVYTHEFALNRPGLIKELHGEQGPPTPREIIELIPEDKRIIIVVDNIDQKTTE